MMRKDRSYNTPSNHKMKIQLKTKIRTEKLGLGNKSMFYYILKYWDKMPKLKGWSFVIIITLIFFGMFFAFLQIGEHSPIRQTGDNLNNMSILMFINNLIFMVWVNRNVREPL